MIASAAMLLDWLGVPEVSELIDRGLRETVAQGTRTADLGGSASTTEFTAAVIKSLV
jgi:3-isopropylmalate dehydrogenase